RFDKPMAVSFVVFLEDGSALPHPTRVEHGRLLKMEGMEFTERWKLTLGAALFRDMKGFPNDPADIATERDPGDLFRGNWVRGRDGTLGSHPWGLVGYLREAMFHHADTVPAGSPKFDLGAHHALRVANGNQRRLFPENNVYKGFPH